MEFKTKKQAVEFSGTLSNPAKMPGKAWGLAALDTCKTGSALAKIPGSVCHDCYACKGCYQFKLVKIAHKDRLEKTKGRNWVNAMVKMLDGVEYFRWHDSGDLYSMAYLQRIVRIIEMTPNTKHWLPTKEKQMIQQFMRERSFPSNVVVRVSGAMVDGAAPKGNFNTSTVVTDGSHNCPAYKQGGECGDCRQCWDKSVANVSYPKH